MPKLFAAWLLALSLTGHAVETLHIAVASNFKPVLEALQPEIEATLAVKLLISSASTAKLTSQLLQGAAYDVFLSADDQSYRFLLQHNIGSLHSVYAVGQLAFYSRQSLPANFSLQQRYQTSLGERWSIANPKLAPYGVAAVQSLAALEKSANNPTLSSAKLIYAENISLAFTYVRSGNVDAGFVALSALLMAGIDEGYYQLVASHYYTPIRQQALLINSSAASVAFFQLLLSPAMQEKISHWGYVSL
jgi:molybdenum ABC transporter molybdate-binding protein